MTISFLFSPYFDHSLFATLFALSLAWFDNISKNVEEKSFWPEYYIIIPLTPCLIWKSSMLSRYTCRRQTSTLRKSSWLPKVLFLFELSKKIAHLLKHKGTCSFSLYYLNRVSCHLAPASQVSPNYRIISCPLVSY
jgi:hypothetical protein